MGGRALCHAGIVKVDDGGGIRVVVVRFIHRMPRIGPVPSHF